MKPKPTPRTAGNVLEQTLFAARKGELRKLRELIPTKAPARFTGAGGATPLILAAENGHLKAVQFLIGARSDLNATATGSWTALMLASRQKHTEVVRALLEAGADPNVESKLSDTALSIATKLGHSEIVDLLLKHRARSATSHALDDVAIRCLTEFFRSRHSPGNFGRAPSLAQRQAAETKYEALLKQVRKLVLNGAQGGDYALLQAAVGCEEMVVLLLEAKANPNRWATLAKASKNGQLNILRRLLLAGAAMDHGDPGECPLIEAIRHDHPDIVEELIRTGADINRRELLGPTPLTLATTQGALGIMRQLIEAKVDLNLPGTVKIGPKPKPRYGKGWAKYPDAPEALDTRPLIIAARRNHFEATRLLAEAGADLEAVDPEGFTALAWAQKLKQKEIQELLEAAGANRPVHLEGSPLHALIEAASLGKRQRVEELLRDGADPDGHLDSITERRTPLARAAQHGHAGIVTLLLNAGAKVDKPVGERLGSRGVTPLMVAAKHGHADVASVLINHGADLHATNVEVFGGGGFTPLHYAALNGNAKIIHVLLTAGANPSARDKGQSTPLQIAASNGSADAIKALATTGRRIVARKGKASRLLRDAVHIRNLQTVRAILKANPAAHGDDPELASVACFDGKLSIVQLLSAGGLDFGRLDPSGTFPLLCAVMSQRDEIVEFLIRGGVDLNLVSSDGETALDCATRIGAVEIARILEKAGAQPATKPARSRTTASTARRLHQGAE